MQLLLFRHGPAGERAAWARTGHPDEDRPLTAEGRERVRLAINPKHPATPQHLNDHTTLMPATQIKTSERQAPTFARPIS